MHQISVRPSVRLSVCPTPFNSETVADMDKLSKATPPKIENYVRERPSFFEIFSF